MTDRDEASSSTVFASVSAVHPGPDRFDAEISPDSTIDGKPNGGYLLAMLGRAASVAGSHPHVVAASAHYLTAPRPGPVIISTQLLRAGRSASQLSARMSQDGRPCVESLLTTSQLQPDSAAFWDGGVPKSGTAPLQDCVRIPGRSPNGLQVAIMDQVEVRIEPGDLGFATGRPSGRGELRGWLTLPAGEAFTPESLLFSVDAFPPATFDIEMTGWVPTLELTAYVRALPAPGPVRVLQRAQLIEGRRVDESCWVWDRTGRLVAHGTQLAGIHLG